MARLYNLTLNNFRNHESISIEFVDGVNLIIGRNASGKTNVLESIYTLLNGKSFRQINTGDLTTWGKDICRIEGHIEFKGTKHKLTTCIEGENKYHKIGDKKRRLSSVSDPILFVPDDVMIFKMGPGARRNFIDRTFSAIDIDYKDRIKEYKQILSQRNNLIKKIRDIYKNADEQLSIWSEKLILTGTEIVLLRKEIFDILYENFFSLYKEMGGIIKSANAEYFTYIEGENRDEIKREFEKKLDEKRELEIIRGVTLVGPHRDDWTILLDGKDIRTMGSQGQMRIAAVTLKVVELQLVNERNDKHPILLLDDVISELDRETVKKLLEFVKGAGGQIIITSTERESFFKDNCPKTRVISLKDGLIETLDI